MTFNELLAEQHKDFGAARKHIAGAMNDVQNPEACLKYAQALTLVADGERTTHPENYGFLDVPAPEGDESAPAVAQAQADTSPPVEETPAPKASSKKVKAQAETEPAATGA